MLAAQAQTQIRLEHEEISSWAAMSELITRAVLEGALPTSVFALLSSLLLCAEGDESYFYVHDHLYNHHSGVPLWFFLLEIESLFISVILFEFLLKS